MKQKDVFKKIGGIIQELSDQYEYLETVNGELNDLELELFVANAHFLTDHIEILCKLNLQNNTLKRPSELKETTYEQKYFEPVVQQMKYAAGVAEEKPADAALKPEDIALKQEDTAAPKPNDVPLKVEETAIAKDEQPVLSAEPVPEPEPVTPVNTNQLYTDEPLVADGPAIDNTQNRAGDDTPAENEVVEKTIIIATSGETPLSHVESKEDIPLKESKEEITLNNKKWDNEAHPGIVVDEVLTINQKISSQLSDKTTGRTEQSGVKPISDIKLAITLNDKLLYVKDLFNGYNLAYSEAIEILNRFNNFDEAMRFLRTNYITKNNWESKPATTEKFYALLKRRYA